MVVGVSCRGMRTGDANARRVQIARMGMKELRRMIAVFDFVTRQEHRNGILLDRRK